MKYYIIAGEASGDIHAAYLMKAIKGNDPDAEFRFWGGDKMSEQGGTLVKHYRDLAFMGLVEVLKNLRVIIKNLSFCKKDIAEYSPDAVIFVDYPGFNLKIAKFAHKKGIKTIYYISPQIWAWHRSRVHKIKRIIDLMLSIVPFEKDFYEKYNYPVKYVGNPLLDELSSRDYLSYDGFVKKNRLPAKPIVALLPGSRTQEIRAMLKTMVKTAENFKDYQFVIAGTKSQDDSVYGNRGNIPVVYGQTHNLLAVAKAALVASGTASLETAIIGTPHTVCYRTSFLTYRLAKSLIRVNFISLVNLIMDKEVVKELIQNDFNVEKLTLELKGLLFDKEKIDRIKNDYLLLRKKLGNSGASVRAAAAIHEFLTKS
jgi:lipid-A-disaccharide synthase